MKKLMLMAALIMGSGTVQAADPHDIIGGLFGLAILHEIFENDEPRYNQRHYVDPDQWRRQRNERRNRMWSRNGDGREYHGDIYDAYDKSFPCGNIHAPNGCTKIYRGGKEIIIIHR